MSNSQTQLSWYYKRKQDMFEYLGDKCSNCGSIAELHIHHRDPTQKEFTLSGKYSYAWETLKRELDKCILLCIPCHTKRHNPGKKHGTMGMYKHGKCRCDKCREANRQYTEDYRARYGRRS